MKSYKKEAEKHKSIIQEIKSAVVPCSRNVGICMAIEPAAICNWAESGPSAISPPFDLCLWPLRDRLKPEFVQSFSSSTAHINYKGEILEKLEKSVVEIMLFVQILLRNMLASRYFLESSIEKDTREDRCRKRTRFRWFASLSSSAVSNAPLCVTPCFVERFP